MKNGDDEAGEIRYVSIRKNSQGMEEIEVQGRFLACWLEKRIVDGQFVTENSTEFIMKQLVTDNAVNAANAARAVPNLFIADTPDLGSGVFNYASEPYINLLLGVSDAAKAAKLGFVVNTDVRAKKHYFRVYKGQNLTADQTNNAPCIFSQEFDNILEQEYHNSVENYRTTAYVGGEELPDKPRKVAVVGGDFSGLDRDEVFINATDIVQTSTDKNGNEVTIPDAKYLEMLNTRGNAELAHFAETLHFSNKVNTYANLKYRVDYDLGDRVTCINKRWGIKINVRITEITETYQNNIMEIDITFGESLPALIDSIRQVMKER